MPEPVILVPRRSDGGPRDRIWDFIKPHWEAIGPVFEGEHLDGPFNRSAACNAAAAAAGDWEVAVIIDSDVIVSASQVATSVNEAAKTGNPAIAYSIRKEINEHDTDLFLNGRGGLSSRRPAAVLRNACSSANVIRRDLWEAVEGFDERFVSWGWEDVAFKYATECMAEHVTVRSPGTLWHLWHPRTTEVPNRHDPLQQANKALHVRYHQVRRDQNRMRALIAERRNP